ncbi:MAG TPA: nicotinamide-nucleotide amidohydrolase family protein [Planctomycetaceae bacterium]|nr:nicotinamide-nucleotide amidohydrolase family protein [Planctomycetaceae bacterium]
MTTPIGQRDLDRRAQELARRLRARSLRIVFAESCTGGLVSASLTSVAGVSEQHCGSAVVYRPATKAGWLGVSPQALEDPGPVSREVAEAMALGVLERTPEADLAVSVTGHLGPGAPGDLDGLVYVSTAARSPAGSPEVLQTEQFRLPGGVSSAGRGPRQFRRLRQRQAAVRVLDIAIEAVARLAAGGENSEAAEANVC